MDERFPKWFSFVNTTLVICEKMTLVSFKLKGTKCVCLTFESVGSFNFIKYEAVHTPYGKENLCLSTSHFVMC